MEMVIGVETSALAVFALENGCLKARVVELEALLEAREEKYQQQLAELVADKAALTAEVARLKELLAKDSHNSSKPPASDGLRKRTKSMRERSGRKPGGQPGHEGYTLQAVAEPDHIETHALPARCDVCGRSLRDIESKAVELRQVFDLPPIKLEVTEHRTLEGRCKCGKVHRSEFPEWVRHPVQYGPRIRSKGVYLTQYQLLPIDRTRQLLADLFGANLSCATIQTSIEEAASLVKPAVAMIAERIKNAAVAHFDETGMRVAKSLHWLHIAATALLTWYGCHKRRGKEAMDAFGILPEFKGTATHDGLKAYFQYACTHALCNAHHLRELIFVWETSAQAWSQQMIELLLKAKAEVARSAGNPLPPSRIADYQNRFDALVSEGEALNPPATATPGRRGRVKQTTSFNLLARLRQYRDETLRFILDPQVAFDNNQAERDARMPKAKQKISGCFRTLVGAQDFCTIRSYLATLRKQKRDLLDALVQTFHGNPPDPCPSG